MKNKFLVHGLVIIAMTFGSFVSAATSDSGPMLHQAGGLPYLSGGVGEESQQLLSSRASEFNVKLVFALTSGAYLSSVKVAIAPAMMPPKDATIMIISSVTACAASASIGGSVRSTRGSA